MSHNEHAAGGLEGLNLGAPVSGTPNEQIERDIVLIDYLAFSLDAQIGGGVSTTPAHGLGSSTTTSTSTTGINSGLTSGSHHHTTDRDHLDRTGDAHRTSTGAAAANVTKPGYDLDAKNTTSGERGIGGGHGGPTAFESNPERVGTDRKHDGPRDHSLGGLTGSTVEEVQRQGPGVVRSGDHDLHGKETRGNTFGELDKTGSHGHHDRDHTHDSRTGSNVPVVGSHGRDHESRTGSNIPVVGTHDRTGSNVPVVGGGVPHGEHHSHHTGAGVAAGGLAAGAGAAALGAGGVGGAKPSGYEGVVGDSVTGQQHFKGNSTGLATGAGLAGVGAGAGAAGLGHRETVGGPAATGVSPGTLSGSSHRDEKPHHKETGLVAELKQELKDHQNCKFNRWLTMLYFSCDLLNRCLCFLTTQLTDTRTPRSTPSLTVLTVSSGTTASTCTSESWTTTDRPVFPSSRRTDHSTSTIILMNV